MTPDLLLAPSWIGSLALAALGLRRPGTRACNRRVRRRGPPRRRRRPLPRSRGLLLLLALAATYASRRVPSARADARRPGRGSPPASSCSGRSSSFEVARGWPMLRHRLADTQARRRPVAPERRRRSSAASSPTCRRSWRVLARPRRECRGAPGATPSARCSSCRMHRSRRRARPARLWSRVAEPHWVAPAMLALGRRNARAPTAPPRRLRRFVAAAVAAALVAAVHAWVLVPQAVAPRAGVVRRAPRHHATSSTAGPRSLAAPCARRAKRRGVAAGARGRLGRRSALGHLRAARGRPARRRTRRLQHPVADDFDELVAARTLAQGRRRSSGSPTTASGRRPRCPCTRSSHPQGPHQARRPHRRVFTIAVFLRRAEG